MATRPPVIALALALLGCGAGQSTPKQSPREGTAEQGAPEEERLPPPPETYRLSKVRMGQRSKDRRRAGSTAPAYASPTP